MMNHTAHCTETAFGELECTLPFKTRPSDCRSLIADWKAGIPYRNRAYDPKSKVWRFMGAYRDVGAALLLQHFPDAEVPRRARRPTPAPSPIGHDAFRILHLRETAPVELIEASYRVLARINHPDHGGTNEAMQAVNGAYAALKARVAS